MASHFGTSITLKDGTVVPAPEGFDPRNPDWEAWTDEKLRAAAGLEPEEKVDG